MDKSKRDLTKVLGVASASVAIWEKPIVDAVSLPAHAQTSCGGGCYPVLSGFIGGTASVDWDPAASTITFWFESTSCASGANNTVNAIVGGTREQATAALNCTALDTLDISETTDIPCTVWFCDSA